MPAGNLSLNLPVSDLLSTCQNLLIAGMGGGFDIFCGLPIYQTLKQRGQSVHLANLSFSEIGYGKHAIHLTDTLVGVQAQQRSILPYFPELHLTRWFQEKHEDFPSLMVRAIAYKLQENAFGVCVPKTLKGG